MVFSKGDLRKKKMLCPLYGERKEKKRERRENFGFLDHQVRG